LFLEAKEMSRGPSSTLFLFLFCILLQWQLSKAEEYTPEQTAAMAKCDKKDTRCYQLALKPDAPEGPVAPKGGSCRMYTSNGLLAAALLASYH